MQTLSTKGSKCGFVPLIEFARAAPTTVVMHVPPVALILSVE